jgi:hypothetical protein
MEEQREVIIHSLTISRLLMCALRVTFATYSDHSGGVV